MPSRRMARQYAARAPPTACLKRSSCQTGTWANSGKLSTSLEAPRARGRVRALGDRSGFWSIRPRDLLTDPPIDPVEHAIRQIHLTYSEIDEAIQNSNASQFFFLKYESFCHNPADELSRFEDFTSKKDQVLTSREAPPSRFTASAGSTSRLSGDKLGLYAGLPEWFRSRYPVKTKTGR